MLRIEHCFRRNRIAERPMSSTGRRRGGGTLVLLAAGLTIMTLVMALVLNTTQIAYGKSAIQSATDASAILVAKRMSNGEVNQQRLKQEVVDFLAKYYSRQKITYVDIMTYTDHKIKRLNTTFVEVELSTFSQSGLASPSIDSRARAIAVIRGTVKSGDGASRQDNDEPQIVLVR